MDQAVDAELVSRALKGDEAAFEEIVRRFSPRVFRTIGKFFRRTSAIEELAQDIFLKIYTKLDNYKGSGSFEGWITQITVNACLNALRSSKRHPESLLTDLSEEERKWLENNANTNLSGRDRSAEENLIAADLADRLLSMLSPDDQLALTLIDAEEFSIKEASEITGWSESKVKVQAFRARRRMREALEKLLYGK